MTGLPVNGLAVASASDVLCLEVATQLVEAFDGIATTSDTAGFAEWSVWVADDVGRQRAVEIARVPFEREAVERRNQVLQRADVVMLATDATPEMMPVAEAAIAAIRDGWDGARRLVVFALGPSAGGGMGGDEIRDALGLSGDVDVVIAAGSADREALRNAFRLAVGGVSAGAGLAPPVVAPAATSAGPATAEPAATNGPVAMPATPEPPQAPETTVAPFGVELNPAAAQSGSVEISAPVWEALAELVGGIDHRGDPRRTLLVSGLLAQGVVSDRQELAGTDALWIQPVVAPAAERGVPS